MNLRTIATALAVMAWLWAPAAARGGEAPDPCRLVSEAQAAQVLGAPVRPPRGAPVMGLAEGRGCTWFTATDLAKHGGVGSLKLVIYSKASLGPDSPFASPKAYYERTLAAIRARGGELEELTGLGEGAYWLPGADTLSVLARGVCFTVQVRDLKKFQAADRRELDRVLSEHRRRLSRDVAVKIVMPGLP